VAKLNPTGSAMVWATFLGGTGPDIAQTIALDPAGDVWVSGTTQSANFPKASGWPNGGEFLAEFNPTGSELLYSALFPVNTVAAALAVDSGGTIHFGGSAGLVSAFAPASGPTQTAAPWLYGFGNAAGGAISGRVAPGELIAIYGLNIGPATPQWGAFNAAGFMPTSLGGVQVTIGGTAAALLYVSSTQINLVAPVELTAGSAAELALTVNGAAAGNFRSMTDSAAPGVFAGAINQDGTLNSASNPAPDGSYVSVWATGTGFFPGRDGQMQTGANAFCNFICGIGVQVNPAGTIPVPASYIGAAPGLVNGVVQIDFPVGPAGSLGYFFTVNGIDSSLFSIYVAQ
jgi:uncharacterized protein (TIGR03437 family)